MASSMENTTPVARSSPWSYRMQPRGECIATYTDHARGTATSDDLEANVRESLDSIRYQEWCWYEEDFLDAA